MIYIDKGTRQRISYQPGCGDLQYDRKDGTALNSTAQNVAISGLTASQQMNLGRSNRLFGTDPGMMGKRLPDLDATGNNKQTTNRVKWSVRVDV